MPGLHGLEFPPAHTVFHTLQVNFATVAIPAVHIAFQHPGTALDGQALIGRRQVSFSCNNASSQVSSSVSKVMGEPPLTPVNACSNNISKFLLSMGPFTTKVKDHFQIDPKDDAVRGALITENGELRWPPPPPAVSLSFGPRPLALGAPAVVT